MEGGDRNHDDYIEIGKWQGNPFTSIPTTMYFCFTTLTCVGYGDIFPVTPAGKVATSGLVLLGSMIITMPLSVLSTHFQQVPHATGAQPGARSRGQGHSSHHAHVSLA